MQSRPEFFSCYQVKNSCVRMTRQYALINMHYTINGVLCFTAEEMQIIEKYSDLEFLPVTYESDMPTNPHGGTRQLGHGDQG